MISNTITLRKYFLWNSQWFCDFNYYNLLFEDIKITNYLQSIFSIIKLPTSNFIIKRYIYKTIISTNIHIMFLFNKYFRLNKLMFFIRRHRTYLINHFLFKKSVFLLYKHFSLLLFRYVYTYRTSNFQLFKTNINTPYSLIGDSFKLKYYIKNYYNLINYYINNFNYSNQSYYRKVNLIHYYKNYIKIKRYRTVRQSKDLFNIIKNNIFIEKKISVRYKKRKSNYRYIFFRNENNNIRKKMLIINSYFRNIEICYNNLLEKPSNINYLALINMYFINIIKEYTIFSVYNKINSNKVKYFFDIKKLNYYNNTHYSNTILNINSIVNSFNILLKKNLINITLGIKNVTSYDYKYRFYLLKILRHNVYISSSEQIDKIKNLINLDKLYHNKPINILKNTISKNVLKIDKSNNITKFSPWYKYKSKFKFKYYNNIFFKIFYSNRKISYSFLSSIKPLYNHYIINYFIMYLYKKARLKYKSKKGNVYTKIKKKNNINNYKCILFNSKIKKYSICRKNSSIKNVISFSSKFILFKRYLRKYILYLHKNKILKKKNNKNIPYRNYFLDASYKKNTIYNNSKRQYYKKRKPLFKSNLFKIIKKYFNITFSVLISTNSYSNYIIDYINITNTFKYNKYLYFIIFNNSKIIYILFFKLFNYIYNYYLYIYNISRVSIFNMCHNNITKLNSLSISNFFLMKNSFLNRYFLITLLYKVFNYILTYYNYNKFFLFRNNKYFNYKNKIYNIYKRSNNTSYYLNNFKFLYHKHKKTYINSFFYVQCMYFLDTYYLFHKNNLFNYLYVLYNYYNSIQDNILHKKFYNIKYRKLLISSENSNHYNNKTSIFPSNALNNKYYLLFPNIETFIYNNIVNKNNSLFDKSIYLIMDLHINRDTILFTWVTNNILTEYIKKQIFLKKYIMYLYLRNYILIDVLNEENIYKMYITLISNNVLLLKILTQLKSFNSIFSSYVKQTYLINYIDEASIIYLIHNKNYYYYYIKYYIIQFLNLFNQIERSVSLYTGTNVYLFMTYNLIWDYYLNSAKMWCEYIVYQFKKKLTIRKIFFYIKKQQKREFRSLYAIQFKSGKNNKYVSRLRHPLRGIRIVYSGNFKKAKRKKKLYYYIWLRDFNYSGKMPLKQFKYYIDYHYSSAILKRSSIGIKFWLLFDIH